MCFKGGAKIHCNLMAPLEKEKIFQNYDSHLSICKFAIEVLEIINHYMYNIESATYIHSDKDFCDIS